MGQLCGDALGTLVEFLSEQEIRQCYPEGLRDMADGGTWNTIAGPPIDDSEMALSLARYLAKNVDCRAEDVFELYRYWLNSNPFDCGNTIHAALTGYKNEQSQANGALMRISPFGIFGAYLDLDKVAEFAMLDAQLTHIHPVCVKSNALYAMAIAYAVRSECKTQQLYELLIDWSRELKAPNEVRDCIERASEKKPDDFLTYSGWVLIALQNAVYHLRSYAAYRKSHCRHRRERRR